MNCREIFGLEPWTGNGEGEEEKGGRREWRGEREKGEIY
jgi:hypothetical protein